MFKKIINFIKEIFEDGSEDKEDSEGSKKNRQRVKVVAKGRPKARPQTRKVQPEKKVTRRKKTV